MTRFNKGQYIRYKVREENKQESKRKRLEARIYHRPTP